MPSQPSTPGHSDVATTAATSIATIEASVNSMSITQPITNLPSSLTPAPVTVVRSPHPPPEAVVSPQPMSAYQAPPSNVMHQASPQQQGMPRQQHIGAPELQATAVPMEQQLTSGVPTQQQQLPPMSMPQSTQVTSLPGALYSQRQTSIPATYHQPPINTHTTIGVTPQVFTSVTGAVSGLPVAPPTFSLPSVPPTISLGPAPALSQSVSAN